MPDSQTPPAKAKSSFGRSFLKWNLIIWGGLLVIGLIGAIIDPVDPKEIEAQKAKEEAATTKAAADKKAKLVTDAKAMWKATVRAAEPCDFAAKDVAAQASKNDVYGLYRTVKVAGEKCRSSAVAINDIDAPEGIPKVAEDAFDLFPGACAGAYLTKAEGYEKFAEVLDGDSRPSAVTAATDAMKDGNNAGMMCAVAFSDALTKAELPADMVLGDMKN